VATGRLLGRLARQKKPPVPFRLRCHILVMDRPPKAAFVTRLRPGRLPGKTARQATGAYRQLSGWNLPPLVFRAVGAHWMIRA